MLKIENVVRLDLGVKAENMSRAIEIDCNLWKEQYPNGNINIYHQRPGETSMDVTGATYDNETGVLRWELTQTDTFIDGFGQAEIRLVEDNVVKKTAKIVTLIHPSVVDTNGGVIESNQQAYLNAAASIFGSTQQEAIDAHAYAMDSEAWAKGTRDGSAVPFTDETFENNAKYYAEQAHLREETARTYATTAVNYGTTAAQSASQATASATAAEGSKTAAANYSISAAGNASQAYQAKLDAQSAASNASSMASSATSQASRAISAAGRASNSENHASSSAEEAAASAAAAASCVTAAEAARDAAQAAAGDFQGLSATASGLPAGSQPNIEVTHSAGGLYQFAFGIPKGDKGDKGDTGDPAPTAQVTAAVEGWLEENMSNPDSPPLDRSLNLSSAAAPADLVGSLKSAIDAEDKSTSALFGLVNYADINNVQVLTKVPSATDSTVLGVTRIGTTALLDGGGINKAIFFKMNGATTGRTVSTATVQSWSDPITLETGKQYGVSLKFLGGVQSARPSVSVYKSGGNSTVGQAVAATEKTYTRLFTFDGAPVHIAVYVPANATFTNALYNIVLYEAENESIYTEREKLDDTNLRINTAANLVNYGYSYDEGYVQDASAGVSSSTRLGAFRNGTKIVLNGGGINRVCFVRLSGELYRTALSWDLDNLADGIALKAGTKYRIKMEFISGTKVGDASVSVYKLGEHTTIGTATQEGNKFIRTFTAPEELVNLVLYVPANVTFDNAEYCIVLEDFGAADESVIPYIRQGTKNINAFATLWKCGGLGSDGANYDSRTTGIRMTTHWNLDNIQSITCSTYSIYLCLYGESNAFIVRKEYSNTTIDYAEITASYPTAVTFCIEIRGCNGALSAYSNVTIIGKEYPAGLETHDITREKAKIMQTHRTSSEKYATCDFRALIVSDVHQEYARMGDIIAVLNYWGLTNYFDVMLNCGDTVLSKQGHDLVWHNDMLPFIGVPYLNAVGNHDAWDTLGHIGDQLTTYQNIIAPIAGQTGIVQPTGAAASGLCYYYYDLNSKYRIVVLDCMYWDAAEATWLENVLADAKTNGLAVVCMSHYGFSSQYVTPMPSLWREVSGAPSDMINIAAAEKVSAFIDGGGTFICWLVGHSHSDNLYQLTEEYNQQMVVTFPSLAQRAGNLLKNENVNAYNYIVATQMTIDDYQHTVRFLRIGANIDTWGIQHNGLTLDYVNRKLIAAW